MTNIEAIKAHTNGNDFLLIEHQHIRHMELFVKKIAHRRLGIGCDQVIYFKYLEEGKAQCSFYNQDGSGADLCLNGVFALATFLQNKETRKWEIVTSHHCFHSQKITGQVVVTLAKGNTPTIDDVLLTSPHAKPEQYNAKLVQTGNQHLIVQTQQVDNFPLEELALSATTRALFPDGINVSIFEKKSNRLTMRTHERGAGLTLSCGSAGLAVYLMNQPKANETVEVQQPGGSLFFTQMSDKTINITASSAIIATLTINRLETDQEKTKHQTLTTAPQSENR